MGDIADILQILTRDSIDCKAVEESLRYATVKNFINLYDVQRTICGLKRFNIPFRDMKLVTKLKPDTSSKYYPKRYSYSVPINIVTKGKEKACKKLGLYDTPLTQTQIAEYPKVLNYNFLIVLDGMFVNTGDMIISEDSVMITIDVDMTKNPTGLNRTGIPYDVFKKYYDEDAILSLFLLPNFSYGITSCTKIVYENTLVKEIPFVRFANKEFIREDNTMVFVNTDTDPSLLRRVDFSIKKITDTDKRIILDPNINIVNNRISIVAISFDYLFREIDVDPADDGWFQLDGYELPVPIENMVPMIVNDDNTLSTETNMNIRLYYPDIYQIMEYDHTKKVKICIFYKDSVDQAYTNDLALLDILSGKLTDRYRNGSIPESVMNYSPNPVPYFDSGDFINSVFYPDNLLYDIDRFKAIAEIDPDVMIKYICHKLRYMPRYYVYAERLDLDSLIRTDTSNEQDKIVDLIFFDEPTYLFSFSKTFVGSSGFDFRIFIDNLFIPPYEYAFLPGVDYYYFYIPTRLIEKTSILEFEKHKEYDWTTTGIVENNKLTVILPKHLNTYGIYPRDVYVVNKETNEYLDYEEYTITSYNEIMNQVINVDNDKYAKMYDEFTIHFTGSYGISYEGKEVLVAINHRITATTVDLDLKGGRDLPYTVDVGSYNNATNSVVRAFCNGIMLPELAYELLPSGEYGCPGVMGFFVDETFFKGKFNKLTVDLMPVDMKCEFKLDYIENKYGFIDTGNSLSLPFNLKWYDVYVNGMKLNKSNIDIVTSNKFFVKNVKSRYNLYIYCRGDIYDEFMFDHERNYENFLFGEVEEIYEELIKNRPELENSMQNITEGIIEDLRQHFEFVNMVLKYIFINPNTEQITPKIIAKFPELVDETGMLTLVTNQRYMDEIDVVTPINSNKRSNVMKKHRYRYSFTPLHIGNHHDAENGEYMCDAITGSPCMKDIKGDIIPTGEIDRLNIHKNNFNEALAINNLSHLDVYHLEQEDAPGTREVTKDDEMLEGVINTETSITKFVMSIDMDILHKGCQDVMTISDYNPIIEITFKDDVPDAPTQSIKVNLAILSTTIIRANLEKFKLLSVKLLPENEDDTMEEYKCIIHSMLIAF